MYNRYIPQSDGSYRRNSMPDPGLAQKPPPPEAPGASPPPEPHGPPPGTGDFFGIGRFFRQLLPRNFDTEDLLIVLLLLLMSENCEDDSNSALLTLALYLFL